eukprot:m51a1_g2948 hypothetical protein (188) ;mRNA; r:625482-626045
MECLVDRIKQVAAEKQRQQRSSSSSSSSQGPTSPTVATSGEAVLLGACSAAGCGVAEAHYVCSRCHSRSYCSRECQRADWAARHRSECAGLAAGAPAQPRPSDVFVVKVRAPTCEDLGRQPLLCHDREERRQQFVTPPDPAYGALLAAVKGAGHVEGLTAVAWFDAWVSADGKMHIATDRPLEPQGW